MKKYWNYYQCTRFDFVDLTGIGKWILAAFVINGIVMRMCTVVDVDGMTTDLDMFPIFICVVAYFGIDMYLHRKQQFSNSLPFTSREQVNLTFIIMIGCFIGLGVLLLGIATIFFLFNPGEWNELVKENIPIESKLEALFIFFYYLFLTALVLPLGMVRDKKKWYLAFGGVALLVAAVNLVFINLVPSDKAGFKTSGQVFRNIIKIPHFNGILVVMGIVSVSMFVGSYFLIQKLHAPKKY